MNKFDNIRWSESIICVGVKNIIFPIKFVHVAEISITNTNNNHSERIVRATHDLIDSYGQVVYGPISNDQDNLKFFYLRENRSFSKTIVGCLSGAQVGSIHEKKQKNLVTLPL